MILGRKPVPDQPLIAIKIRDITPKGRDPKNPRFEVSGRDPLTNRVRRVVIDVPPEVVLAPNGIERQMRLWELCSAALKQQA